MRQLVKTLLLLALIALVSCEREKYTIERIAGEWNVRYFENQTDQTDSIKKVLGDRFGKLIFHLEHSEYSRWNTVELSGDSGNYQGRYMMFKGNLLQLELFNDPALLQFAPQFAIVDNIIWHKEHIKSEIHMSCLYAGKWQVLILTPQ